ncbi:hypothetical protein AMTR_s00062p00204980 [Amborella trichopoda]|uniref:Uncharacterized protein n=1 Tax=Amborella trichopoda TaxID=13333 RepID=U5DB22_AMBTC|nr:hypothetical protein AMTR_s00062p00204980 [Amborella trichopoda]
MASHIPATEMPTTRVVKVGHWFPAKDTGQEALSIDLKIVRLAPPPKFFVVALANPHLSQGPFVEHHVSLDPSASNQHRQPPNDVSHLLQSQPRAPSRDSQLSPPWPPPVSL